MLGKNGIKVFDHIFPQKLALTFLGDHSITPCIGYKEYFNHNRSSSKLKSANLNVSTIVPFKILIVTEQVWKS
jgi:hypothetical protein